ncbi:hypothetical protein BpHYR1_027862 [Brachionus plicatilis]|uniref:Uncharacterized protein n=1 Tax=Brachionus plicatilis TaxID=10195 RepID=A0A3M7SB61_BRAPC|nr:hypothetical protein BpHYR1_027862 [Brachionus plicatilis]
MLTVYLMGIEISPIDSELATFLREFTKMIFLRFNFQNNQSISCQISNKKICRVRKISKLYF